MSTPPVSPVSTAERSDILDVLRSFALLGICLANYAGFSLFIFQKPEHQAALPTAGIDSALTYLHFTFIAGKFYSLFSLLFGIGFSIILLRQQAAGRDPLPLFYRRLLVLMIIGLAHAWLLWDGDILLLYALLGTLLPFFRNWPDKTLLILALALVFSPLIFDTLKVLTNGDWTMGRSLRTIARSMDARAGITNGNADSWLVIDGGYQRILDWNRSGFFFRWEFLLDSNRLVKVFAMFLLGLWAGRKMMYAKLEENKSPLIKVRRWGFVIGLPSSLVYTYFELDGTGMPKPLGLADTFFYAVSVIPMSLAYTSSLCLLWLRPRWKTRLLMLAPAGKMALTNYLMQTVLGIFIFYGIGLGLGSRSGPAVFMPIAAGVYFFQLLYSHIWFRYFRFGPMEWVWRQLAYGKRLRLVKAREF